MSPPGDGEDRAAILRRRAVFVASALSGLAPRMAHAQDAPPLLAPASPEAEPIAPGAPAQVAAAGAAACPPAEPRPEDRERATEHVERALALQDAEDYEAAAHELASAATFATSDRLTAQRMRLAVRLGRPYEAVEAALAHVACGGGIDELRPIMAEIEAATGRLTVTLAGTVPPDVVLLLDDHPIDPARAARGLAVTPGKHRLNVGRAGAPNTLRAVEVVAGQAVEVSLELPPEVPPMPCLNYVDPRVTADRVRLEAAVLPPVPFVAFGEPAKALVSAGGRLALQIALPDKLWLETDLFSTFLGDEHARAVQLGASLEVRMPVSGPYAVGGGFGAGYLFDLGDAQDDSAITSSFFCGPVLLPVHVRHGDAEIEVRLPLWIARTSVDGVGAFRPALFGPLVSIGFAGAVRGSREPDEG